MTSLAEHTIDVTPLGLRGRYSLQTQNQLRLYQLLVAHFDAGDDVSPTVSELVALTGKNRAIIHAQLRALEECRWITRERFASGFVRPRGIRLVHPVLRDLKPAA